MEPARNVGVPDAEVTVTVDDPGVNVPLFVMRVPEVPVRVMVEVDDPASSVPDVPILIKPVDRS